MVENILNEKIIIKKQIEDSTHPISNKFDKNLISEITTISTIETRSNENMQNENLLIKENKEKIKSWITRISFEDVVFQNSPCLYETYVELISRCQVDYRNQSFDDKYTIKQNIKNTLEFLKLNYFIEPVLNKDNYLIIPIYVFELIMYIYSFNPEIDIEFIQMLTFPTNYLYCKIIREYFRKKFTIDKKNILLEKSK